MTTANEILLNELNKAQKDIVCSTGQDLLVSASAGTGKTRVLTYRIGKLIADGEDISSMVVVTFTKLAAAEMKTRVGAVLAKLPQTPHISEQLEKLDMACISTLHSFCTDLARNYFYIADIDPNFSILDESVCKKLQNSAMQQVVQQYFKSNDEVFGKLYKMLATKRKEQNFLDLLFDLYEKLRCLEDYRTWYQSTLQNFQLDQENNPLLAFLCKQLKAELQTIARWECQARDFAKMHSIGFFDVLDRNCNALNGVLAQQDLQFVASLADVVLESLPSRNKKGLGDEGLVEEARQLHEKATDLLGKLLKKVEAFKGKTTQQLCQETADFVVYTNKVMEIIGQFDVAYTEAKRNFGGLDFGDLEHVALQILNNDEARRAVHERYKWVFVDEYQDTNPIQEAIVQKIATRGRLFMVGDVKQSIYGFRGCDPTIFVKKKKQIQSGALSGEVHTLGQNFRSNKGILHFVNCVFSQLMTEDFGDIDYKTDGKFTFGTEQQAILFEHTGAPVVSLELLVDDSDKQVEPSKKKGKNAQAGEQQLDKSVPSQKLEIYNPTAVENYDQKPTQGKLVLKAIRQHLGKINPKTGERISYGDIVVLTRSMTDKASQIYKELVENNVPVCANFKAEAYLNKEVRELVNLLRVVDNPYNDIFVASCCLSPFGKMSEQELAEVRILSDKHKTAFVESLQHYQQHGKSQALQQKIADFLQLVEDVRFVSRSSTVDVVLLYVLQRTNFHLFVQAFPNGGMRVNKMYTFIDSLKGNNFAQSVDKFIAFLDDSQGEKKADVVFGGDAVRMMTMHASKGLEFPVVILPCLETEFRDDHDAVLLDTELGVSMKHYDFDQMLKWDTVGNFAVTQGIKNKQKQEELRLLYVAMTRAECNLVLVAKTTSQNIQQLPERASACKSHLDWILHALAKLQDQKDATFQQLVQQKYFKQSNNDFALPNLDGDESASKVKQETDVDKVMQQIGYVYPFQQQQEMPSKLVSSALDKLYLDIHTEEQQVILQNDERSTVGKIDDPAAVGTAYHIVLQYAPFGSNVEQIQNVINSLVADGRLQQKFADQLNTSVLFNVLNNAELAQLLGQGKVYREQQFMLYLPYNQVADGAFTDKVMVQGVIDLLVLLPNKAIVVDYKHSSSNEERLQKSYQRQLASYKLAVEQICGISDVECYIMAIEQNKLVAMK